MRSTKRIMHLFLLVIVTQLTAATTVAADRLPLLPDVDEVYPLAPVWHGLTVLHIGDSHVAAGLSAGLRRHFAETGARYITDVWVGSREQTWVTTGRLKELLAQVRPDVVIVTLGTNAMWHKRPDKYATWVRALAGQIGRRACYWLGPPPILADPYGFIDMQAHSCGPCEWFDSRALATPPRPDGKFHLTRGQGEGWAERVWTWMNRTRLPPAALGHAL
ncbi:MAG: hypothetical protein PHU25_01485 [Deltaproteobacteria bacterium]|nr:hypothetical protein [Deltaproteobacteria bacterium]